MLPISSGYIKRRQQASHINNLNNEIIGLKQSVEKLESRNQEWEQEVRKLRGAPKSLQVVLPVLLEDLVSADWTIPQTPYKPTKKSPPLTIGWVIPPMGPVSGGHLSILRLIHFIESKGHKCNIYIYDPEKSSSLEDMKTKLKNYQTVKAQIFYNEKDMNGCDAIFATSWHTAYPVFNYKGNAKKYYLVQDFEPFFDPVGTYSTLAENTYKFGFRGITVGRWLSEKLSSEYGMKCDYVELGLNTKEYFLTNKTPRKKVLFYARPVTPRRGFELGILALQIFHESHPEFEINFAGWDVSPYAIPFPYKNLGIVPISKLNDLYNECAAGLVLSFTNMSLLPLEMLASGCRPVVNDAKHTRMVKYADQVFYAQPSPSGIANDLYEAITKIDQKAIEKMSTCAKDYDLDTLNEVVEKVLVEDLIK